MRRLAVHVQRKKKTSHSHHHESAKRTRSPISPLALRTPIQPKLKVNPPGDRYEQEADDMANRVMRMPESQPQRLGEEEESLQTKSLASQITPLAQRQAESEEETAQTIQRQEEEKTTQTLQRQEAPEEETAQTLQRQEELEEETAQTLQRQEAPEEETAQTLQRQEESEEETAQPIQRQEKPEEETAQTLQRQEETEETAQAKAVSGVAPKISPHVESRIQSKRGGGQPLSDSTRAFFEPRFGADFSGVRVHTDAEANSLSSEINARAFTVGQDIFVGSGQYKPDSGAGRQLLAHELTHTVQQGGGLQRKANLSSVRTPRVQMGWWGSVKSWLGSVKEKAVRKLKQGINWLAERTIPGYTLLTVFLGENPITGDAVVRSGVNLIKGYMRLDPVFGSILLSELKETKTLPEAGKWVEARVAKLGIDFDDIARRLKLMWGEISALKGIKGNVQVVKKYLWPVLGQILALSSVVMEKVKELRFEAALRLIGATELLDALKKDPKAFKKAVDDPKAILKKFMVGALTKGFSNFKDNFVTHFKNVLLLGWLFGKAAEMGVEKPKKWDISSLFSLIAQLVGATYQQIRAIVVKRLGPKGEAIVSKMEQTVAFVKELVTKGPIVLWERVKSTLKNLKEMFFSKIATLVSTEIITTAVGKLLSMLNPAEALVQLALTLYRVIKFFIDQWETIKSVAMGILNSIAMVALNKIGPAAKFVEKVLAQGMKLIIAFLARIFGLGGIADKVKKLIKKISDPVKKAINKVIDWLVKKAKALWKKGKTSVKKGIRKFLDLWKIKKKFKTKEGQSHRLYFKQKGKKVILIIASNGQSYQNFIKGVIIDTKDPESAKKNKAKETAIKIAEKIDNLVGNFLVPNKGAYTPEHKRIPDFEDLLNQLGVQTAIFMTTEGVAVIRPSKIKGNQFTSEEGLKNIFGEKNYKEYKEDIQNIKKQHPKLLGNIPNIQLIALRGYTDEHYKEINTALLKNDTGTLTKLSTFLDQAILGLSNLPKFRGKVHRGVSLNLQDIKLYEDSQKNRTPKTERNFTSCSAGPPPRQLRGNVQFGIESKTGRDIRKIARHESENEVLFAPSVSFYVLEIYTFGIATLIELLET